MNRFRLNYLPNGSCEEVSGIFHGVVSLTKSPRLAPLDAIATHLANLGVSHSLIQTHVQDPDYLEEYREYYSRQFKETDRYCIRVHFFANKAAVEITDPLSFIDSCEEDHYLGFVTLRPTSNSPVAATILRPPPIGDMFVTCKERFDVHLAGRTFHVEGTPFLQQDNAVGACAQASLWMALRTIRKRDGNRAYSPAQITTTAATSIVFGRMMPNREGLNINQITHVIQAAGYSTHVISFGKAPKEDLTADELSNAKVTLYRYIESGIPVLLVLQTPEGENSHAVVVIGHGKLAQQKNPRCLCEIRVNGTTMDSAKFNLVHASSWFNDLIIHDDGAGPYKLLRESNKFTQDKYSLKDAKYAIPLLPSDVFLSGEEAAISATKIVEQTLGDILKISPWENLIKRTYLMDRNELREWAAAERNMSHSLKSIFRATILPRRLWVTEINLPENYHTAGLEGHSSTRLAELVCDATSDPGEDSFLLFHINSRLIDQTRTGVVLVGNPIKPSDTPTPSLLPDDVPYGPYSRH